MAEDKQQCGAQLLAATLCFLGQVTGDENVPFFLQEEFGDNCLVVSAIPNDAKSVELLNDPAQRFASKDKDLQINLAIQQQYTNTVTIQQNKAHFLAVLKQCALQLQSYYEAHKKDGLYGPLLNEMKNSAEVAVLVQWVDTLSKQNALDAETFQNLETSQRMLLEICYQQRLRKILDNNNMITYLRRLRTDQVIVPVPRSYVCPFYDEAVKAGGVIGTKLNKTREAAIDVQGHVFSTPLDFVFVRKESTRAVYHIVPSLLNIVRLESGFFRTMVEFPRTCTYVGKDVSQQHDDNNFTYELIRAIWKDAGLVWDSTWTEKYFRNVFQLKAYYQQQDEAERVPLPIFQEDVPELLTIRKISVDEKWDGSEMITIAQHMNTDVKMSDAPPIRIFSLRCKPWSDLIFQASLYHDWLEQIPPQETVGERQPFYKIGQWFEQLEFQITYALASHPTQVFPITSVNFASSSSIKNLLQQIQYMLQPETEKALLDMFPDMDQKDVPPLPTLSLPLAARQDDEQEKYEVVELSPCWSIQPRSRLDPRKGWLPSRILYVPTQVEKFPSDYATLDQLLSWFQTRQQEMKQSYLPKHKFEALTKELVPPFLRCVPLHSFWPGPGISLRQLQFYLYDMFMLSWVNAPMDASQRQLLLQLHRNLHHSYIITSHYPIRDKEQQAIGLRGVVFLTATNHDPKTRVRNRNPRKLWSALGNMSLAIAKWMKELLSEKEKNHHMAVLVNKEAHYDDIRMSTLALAQDMSARRAIGLLDDTHPEGLRPSAFPFSMEGISFHIKVKQKGQAFEVEEVEPCSEERLYSPSSSLATLCTEKRLQNLSNVLLKLDRDGNGLLDNGTSSVEPVVKREVRTIDEYLTFAMKQMTTRRDREATQFYSIPESVYAGDCAPKTLTPFPAFNLWELCTTLQTFDFDLEASERINLLKICYQPKKK